jgi:hypothetical protein
MPLRHEDPCTLHTNPGHGSDEKKRTVVGAVSSLFLLQKYYKRNGGYGQDGRIYRGLAVAGYTGFY